MKLKKSFINYCENNLYEVNEKQLEIISKLELFYKNNFQKSFFSMFFKKNSKKFGFYLAGDVGVGKTMILDFFYNQLHEKKLRLHFNEFMIKFHEFNFKNKDKETSIKNFVRNLEKKAKLIFFDEFQVTNIVDAMILGRLFKKIFDEKIKVIFSSNIRINDLYKDGLQREQFLHFISIIKNFSIQKELSLKDDYRLKNNGITQRIFFPLDKKTTFRINQRFREFTKNKKREKKIVTTKGRDFIIENFYSGVVRFNFKDLCDAYLGAEDYVNIAKRCKHIFIEGIPNFENKNSNQQLRFITLIDILYEKKITLTLSLEDNLHNLSSSKKHSDIFKRTLSRMFEMTKTNQ